MSNQERQAHEQHEPEVIGGGNDRRLVWANRVIDAIQTNPNRGEYPADMFRGLYGLLYQRRRNEVIERSRISVRQ